MTSPNTPKPSAGPEGYESVHSRGSTYGQDLTEQGVEDLLIGGARRPFSGAHTALGSMLSGLVGGIAGAISGAASGIFGPIGLAMKPIRDGQEDLKHNTDLLSPLLNYGSVYAPTSNRRHGTGAIRFTEQLGPMRGCEVYRQSNSWGIRLLERGLWDITMHVTMDGLITFVSDRVTVKVQVLRPDGTVFSEQAATFRDDDHTTLNVSSSVVVPGSNYRVRGLVSQNDPRRGILGGPAWSRLTVQQISKDVEGAWKDGSESSDADPS